MRLQRTVSAVTALIAFAVCAPASAETRTNSVSIGDGVNMVKVPLSTGTDSGDIIALPVYPGSTPFGPKLPDSEAFGAWYVSSDSLASVSGWFRAHLPTTWKMQTIDGAPARTIVFSWSGATGGQAVLMQFTNGQTSIIEATGRP